MNKSLAISASLLLGSNLVALVFALWFRWNLFEIVLLYWIQALIIGAFQRRKVRDMVAYAMSIKTTVDLGAHVIEHSESRRVPVA